MGQGIKNLPPRVYGTKGTISAVPPIFAGKAGALNGKSHTLNAGFTRQTTLRSPAGLGSELRQRLS